MKLVFRQDSCIGCRLCQLACSTVKEQVFNPHKARIRITSLYRKSGLFIGGAVCDMCLSCRDACPENAINAEEEFDSMLGEYYSLRGWDTEGRPTDRTLQRLGIDPG